MIDYTQGANVQYHIGVSEDQVGKYVILTGDPARVREIAMYLKDSSPAGKNREYESYTGYLEGEKVTVISTGIGGPSMAIALEELVRLHAHTFLRIGTSGGMELSVQGGDLCIASGAIRAEGTSRQYAPVEFPAVPHFEVLEKQIRAARQLKLSYHVGVVHSKDSFYGQHEPEKSPVKKQLIDQWEAYYALGTICSEMESSTLFIVGQALHVRTGAMFMALANQEREKRGLENVQNHDLDPMYRCAIETIRDLIQEDKKEQTINGLSEEI